MQLLAKELRQPLAYMVVFAVGGLCPIYADILFEVAVEFIEASNSVSYSSPMPR